MKGVLLVGFEHEISLNEKCSHDIMSEACNLTQLNPGGEILIQSTQQWNIQIIMNRLTMSIKKYFLDIYPLK